MVREARSIFAESMKEATARLEQRTDGSTAHPGSSSSTMPRRPRAVLLAAKPKYSSKKRDHTPCEALPRGAPEQQQQSKAEDAASVDWGTDSPEPDRNKSDSDDGSVVGAVLRKQKIVEYIEALDGRVREKLARRLQVLFGEDQYRNTESFIYELAMDHRLMPVVLNRFLDDHIFM